MKNCLTLLTLATLLTACRLHDVEPPPTERPDAHLIELGQMSLQRNGQPLTFLCAARLDDDSLLSIYTERQLTPHVIEHLDIADVPARNGIFKLEKGDFWTTRRNGVAEATCAWVREGDEALGYFSTHAENTGDFVEIVEYNPIACTVEGRFRLHLRDYGDASHLPVWSPPDSVTLTEGLFYLLVEK